MDKEKTIVNQDLSAGAGSQNYQAGNDVTVHNHNAAAPKTTSLHVPTNAQIAEFDPKVQAVLAAARPSARPKFFSLNSPYLEALLQWTLIISFVVAIILIANKYHWVSTVRQWAVEGSSLPWEPREP